MAFIKLEDVLEKEIVPGARVRFVHSNHMTLAYWTFEAGTVLPHHSHPHEQVTNIIEGKFELTVAGEPRVMSPGDVAVIPGGIYHSAKSITASRIIDVFYPVREDYK